MFNSIVKQVLKVEKQVVSGILYHIEVLLEESTCEKRSVCYFDLFELFKQQSTGRRTNRCQFEVMSRTTGFTKGIVHIHCVDAAVDTSRTDGDTTEGMQSIHRVCYECVYLHTFCIFI
jgi:hypothetical protein